MGVARGRVLLAISIGVALIGAGTILGKSLRAEPPDAMRGARTAPLRVVDAGLAFLDPDGCEEYTSSEGTSARIRKDVVENLGDQAMIISTEFRVRRGDQQEWNTTRTWRVPVEGRIGDVRLSEDEPMGDKVKSIEAGITECWLFVTRKGTYLPPLSGPPPRGPGAKLGEEYAYNWYIHCGATILPFDGRWWKPEPPLSRDPHNPPRGWDDEQQGTITLLARNKARFATTKNQIAELIPTATPKEDPFAGCE